MSLSWWHGLVNRGTLKLKSSAARRLGRRRTESRRILFEPLEPRVLLASNPYINLSNGVANSFTAGQDTWVQIPVRVDNLQDSLGDVGLRSATVELSFSTTALIASAPGRGATESGNTVTITTQAAHNFVVGEAVTITGVNNPVYDGTFTIASVSTTAFTYTDSAHANLPSSGAGAATASFFDQGPVQSVASALGNPTDYAPVVAQGPLVPSTWSFGTGQGAGTIEIATQSPNAADDVTTTDPTNGGTSPDGDILAYVFLHVIHGTSPASNIPINVVDSSSSLLEDTASYSLTNNLTYTLGPDQNATVQVVSDGTAPVTQLSVDNSSIGSVSGGTTYTVPVMLTPNTPGGPGISSANADILFDPTYIDPTSISVTPGNLLPTGWNTGYAVDTSGNYSQDGTPPSVDTAAITMSAVMPGTNAFATLASNSTGSLWVITFTTMPGVSGSTVLNLVPDAEPAISVPTNVSDGAIGYSQYTLSPALTFGQSGLVPGPIPCQVARGTATTTTVTSSNASVHYGTLITFTATVSAKTGTLAPTAGSVDFYDTTTSKDLGTVTSFSSSTGTTSTWTWTTGATTLGATSGDTVTATYSPGSGFGGSSGTTTQEVSPLLITASVMAASKTYDGGAAAAIEGGGLMGVLSGDTVTLNTSGASGTFASKNVGQDITVWVGGLTLGGPQASDYWFETPTTWANITAAPITITPTYNSKTYDGTTSAAATPTITSGTLVGSDTVTGLSETYYSKNAYADAELSVAPGYTVNDGNGGHNYAVTLAYATGSIAARAITVTAATSSKLYDGTTSSTATPTITGTLASGDTAAFTETFTNKNAGTGKTLTVGGSVNDGDGGNNYAVNVVTNTAGSITARAITVTAASTWKTYDGTTSAGATPTITGGSLVSGDSADFGESFASRNAGASVTLTPIGCINDGNGGNNYAVTWADASGVIQPATLWVAAVPNTKAYDGTTSAAAAPTITGTIFGGDTAAFTETFTTKNAGTGKTLNPAGSVNDGNGGNNYTVSFLATGGGAINPTGLTITAAANTKAYDGTTSAAAIPTVTGLQGNDTVTGLAEAYTDPSLGTGKTLNVTGYYICDGNEGANYAVSLVSNTTGAIVTPTTTTVNSSEASAPYGDPVTFTATVTAQSGSIAPAGSVEFYDSTTSTDLGDSTTPASSNGTTSTWTLATTAKTLNATSGDTIVAIYTGTGFGGSSGATTETVTALSITVTAVGSTKDYDGTNASAGVPTISCGSLVSGDTAAFAETYNTQDIGTGLTLTPGGTVNDGNGGNDYTVTFVSDTTGAICQAVPTVAVVDAGGGYDGSGFPATASVAGVVDGVDTTPAATLEGVSPTLTYYAGDDTSGDVLPSAPSAPGIYTVVASFAGSTDYAPAESDPVTFTINPSSPTIMGATIVDGSEVDLTWNDVPTSVSGYSIQQLMADGVTWQEVQTAGANASSAVVIGNFDPPGQYTFQVVAYQEMDEPDDTYELDSQASNQATVTALAWPSSPTGLTATPVSNSEIDLAWTDNATNATSCEVDRTTDGQTWTTVATLDPGATSYNDTGLTDGTMYAYRVRAINSVGGSGYAVNGTSTLPTAPGNLDGTAVSGTEIDLSWTAAAYATGYTISMQEEGSDTWDVIGTVPATQTTFAATGLAPGGTEYAFCVAPTNSTSESAVAYIDLMTVNQAPTFATAPSAGADPVTTTNTTLSVLGADDGGESNLTYSWSIVASPYDGGAYFSVNDSNAAKNTIVTFYAAGDYILQVAATDALGAEADACVDVTVQQTLTGVTVTPNDDAILTGGSTQFTATALDQFGNAMTPQPPFTWSTPPVGTLVPSTGDTAVATYTAPTTGGSTTAQVSAYSGGMTTAANVAVIATPAAADDWVEDVVASVGSNSVDSPYNVTLTGPATFTFHDFSQGNVFRIYDNGALILTTTLVGGYAYGQAMLAAGSHALTVNWASQGQPGNGDECAYRINQEALLALTVSDDSSGDTATAITDGVAETLTVPGVPSASDPTTLTATVCIDPGITQDTDTNRVYLSIEDKNESGQTNQTLYYGPLSQLSAADCTLTTNAQTVDFVILEWVDGKGDGQLDAGDDSREVGVKVVTPWSAVGTWTAGQKCMVQANADGASLAQLAYDITGGESDAGALGNIGQIKRGQQIDVTPLLNLLDSRVRAQIVAATEGQSVQNLSNNVGFGYGPNPTGFALVDLNGETINELFDSVTPGSLSPTPHYKCDGMIEVIYARGLMLGAGLSAGQFDRLNVNVALIQNVYCKERTGIPETQLKPGDWANLMNAPGCWNGMWKNENVIVIDPGNVGWGLQADSTYFGWPIGTQSYSHWLETLAEEYDKPIPWWDLWSTVNSDEVPGYVGQSWWLNIPMLGQKIFNMRTGATP